MRMMGFIADTEEEKPDVYDKRYTCPVCEQDFTSKTMFARKVRITKYDYDMRPFFATTNPQKYEIVVCPHCGYAVHEKYFEPLSVKNQTKVKEEIAPLFENLSWDGDFYTYEQAKKRMEMALACSQVKEAKASEEAYVLLRYAWIVRAQSESAPEDEELQKKNQVQERELRIRALQKFQEAMNTEDFPIAGMDQRTFYFILAALLYSIGKNEECRKLLSRLILMRGNGVNLKNRIEQLNVLATKAMKEDAAS